MQGDGADLFAVVMMSVPISQSNQNGNALFPGVSPTRERIAGELHIDYR